MIRSKPKESPLFILSTRHYPDVNKLAAFSWGLQSVDLMRPTHPDWHLYFESEIAPMIANKIMFPLVEEAHIYLTAIQGDGARFSGDFRKCWEKLPTKDRETLIRHWNTATPVLQTLPHLPYITLVDELISKNKVKSGVVAGTTMDKGLPARLDVSATAKLLGFTEGDISILTAAGKLTPLGDPAPNAPKWFGAVQVIRLAVDQDWLHRATKEIAKYWRSKRLRIQIVTGKLE